MIKLHKKYKPLIHAPNNIRYFVITGGRSSGKSFGTSLFLTGLTFEKNHTILYTRYTMHSAFASVIPEFLHKCELLDATPHFDITKTEIRNKLTNSKILFRGIKTAQGIQTAALKSIEGCTTFVIEECEELVDETIFDTIDLSIRQQGMHNRVIMIMNPTSKEHFVYKRFFEDRGVQPGFNGIKDDVCYIHTSYLDNMENLSQSFLDNIERMKLRRPDKYKHVIEGAWLDRAEGVIFNNWTIGKWNKDIPSTYGIDFGFSQDPTVLVETCIDKKNKKIWLKEHFGHVGLTTSDIYDMTKMVTKNGLLIGDSAEPRLIHEVKARGLNIKSCKKGPGSVLAGINLMLDYDIIIDEGSRGLIKEFRNYIWNDKRSGKPMDNGYDHFIDAARYAITYQLENANKGHYSIF